MSTIDEANDRLNRLAGFLATQSKAHPGEFVLLADNTRHTNIRTVSTGAIGLDVAIGGGIPFGRITEIFGNEGSGKTTVALTAARNCQTAGGVIGFVDTEHGLNRELCANIGINFDRFVVVQPDCGEEAIAAVESMLESGAFDMIIVDSIAAMVPKAEIDGDVEQQFMGLHARLISRFMRRVAPKVSEAGAALVLINQVRVSLAEYGAPERATGGKAIKFWASLRVEVRSNIQGKKIERNKQIVGQTVTATVRKNRLGAPGKIAEFDIIFGRGVDGSGSLLDAAEDLGLITRAGASYTEVATGERIGIGKENIKTLFASADGAEIRDRLTKAVYAALAGTPKLEVVPDLGEAGTAV
jgi:recombination protein RecA